MKVKPMIEIEGLTFSFAGEGEEGEVPTVAGKPATAVGVWRGKANVSLLVTKVEALQMLDRLHLPGEEKAEEKGEEKGNEKGKEEGEGMVGEVVEGKGEVEELQCALCREAGGGSNPLCYITLGQVGQVGWGVGRVGW